MFEEYLQDSHAFLMLARNASEDRESRRYYRASVFYAAGTIEAFLNYVADSFAKAESLTSHEIAFLNDKTFGFSPKKRTIVQEVEFHRLEDKLRLLLHKFVPHFDFSGTTWCRIMEFKAFRDSLVHPRQSEDETQTGEYEEKVSAGVSAIIEIMNEVNQGVFGKPLRRQLLDLIPE